MARAPRRVDEFWRRANCGRCNGRNRALRVALIVGGLVFGDPIILEPIENGRIYLNVEQHTDVRDVAARLATRLGQ